MYWGEEVKGGGWAGADVCGEPPHKRERSCRLFANAASLSAETVKDRGTSRKKEGAHAPSSYIKLSSYYPASARTRLQLSTPRTRSRRSRRICLFSYCVS